MRKDILNKKDEIINWVNEHKSKAFIAQQLKCKQSTLNVYLKQMGIEYAGKQGWNDGLGTANIYYIKAEEYLGTEKFITSHRLKQKLINEGIKENRCEKCGRVEWLGQPIPLELHHINGNHYDNRLDNIQILCPNCHTLEPNNSGAANKQPGGGM